MPNRTFYFSENNLRNLLAEETPNQILNMLLSNHYAGKIPIRSTETVASVDKMDKFEELKKKFPPLELQTVVPAEEAA